MTRSHSLVADAEDLFIENAEKLKFCFLKNRKEQLRTPCLAYHCNENRWVRHACRMAERERERAKLRSKTLWINRGTLPSYTFKINGRITTAGESLPIICGKTQVSKATGPKRRAQDCPPYQCGCVWFCLVGRVTPCAPSFRSRFTTRAKTQRQRFGFLQPFQFGSA